MMVAAFSILAGAQLFQTQLRPIKNSASCVPHVAVAGCRRESHAHNPAQPRCRRGPIERHSEGRLNGRPSFMGNENV